MSWVEATLILPRQPNNVPRQVAKMLILAAYQRELAQVETALLGTFGGFTVVEGRGASKWGDEQVNVYTIALPNDRLHLLHDIAHGAKRTLDQDAVYLSFRDIKGSPLH